MNATTLKNMARHVGIQIGVAAAFGVIGVLTKTDWSALGAYGPLIATVVAGSAATATAALNGVLAANK